MIKLIVNNFISIFFELSYSMENNTAIKLLKTLGNDFRLPIIKMLIKAGKQGLNPSYISSKLDIKPNKLSFHLNDLKKINLITSKKSGREIIYFANYKLMNNLVDFLFDQCCVDDEDGACITDKNSC
jgi:ArsR family transcriptional regulator